MTTREDKLMKLIKIILCFLVLLLFVTACTAQKHETDEGASDSVYMNLPDESKCYYNPLYFSDEAALFEAIREVKEKEGEDDDTVIIKIGRREESYDEYYDATYDRNDLASISECYRPSYIPEGLSLTDVMVSRGVASYCYANDDGTATAFFSLVIGTTPEKHMNELFGRGAMSERILEYNGVEYVFLGWMNIYTYELDGYSIHWVVDGKCFIADIEAGYTDEEMLAFCQFEVVVVE